MGTYEGVMLPNFVWGIKFGGGALRGVRFVHTMREREQLPKRDETYLILFGLDMVLGLEVRKEGGLGRCYYAHMLPSSEGSKVSVERVPDISHLDIDFQALIEALEEEFRGHRETKGVPYGDKAILVACGVERKEALYHSLEELEALARSDEIVVLDKVVQVLKEPDPKLFIGKGKLNEVILTARQKGANLIIFGAELSPAQLRNIADHTDMRIIDRTQLILDIFARRAKTKEGKLQVELAQLRYMLPRLSDKNRAFSRLTGGIGGRGPGETKLEIDKRRVKDRISKLLRELAKIGEQRNLRRKQRRKNQIPIISLVGYTNAGKSTLLNTLTKSSVPAKDRLFETLDPFARRMYLSNFGEVLVTDTVGFIQELPEHLLEAFASTLEELKDADLILEVVDISDQRFEEHIKVVERMLIRLGLIGTPKIRVLNKVDKIDSELIPRLEDRYQGVGVCALKIETLGRLLNLIKKTLGVSSLNTFEEGQLAGRLVLP